MNTNQTLALLLNTPASDDEHTALRALACRAGLLWYCGPCGLHNPGTLCCERCDLPPPDYTPQAPDLTTVPVLATSTGATIAVCDDPDRAAALAQWINESHGGDLATVGTPVPHNPIPSERMIDRLDRLGIGTDPTT